MNFKIEIDAICANTKVFKNERIRAKFHGFTIK